MKWAVCDPGGYAYHLASCPLQPPRISILYGLCIASSKALLSFPGKVAGSHTTTRFAWPAEDASFGVGGGQAIWQKPLQFAPFVLSFNPRANEDRSRQQDGVVTGGIAAHFAAKREREFSSFIAAQSLRASELRQYVAKMKY
ncbi:hypothetical protein F443_10536 [Phytophthora nicotianae P1569]|uniref:Uncharacterized protein n=1 Tax=Phytophthora nicotianae P1569 TaxID=1317065 RepID=V9F123_PHYNI|nr:hypothetical protein F443_10536 [Phytophthora nicotianae P1569]